MENAEKCLVKSSPDNQMETISEMADPGQPEVEQCVFITSGLASSDKDFTKIKVSEVASFLKAHPKKDCYERTQPTEADPHRIFNRVYVDLDGELPFETLDYDFTVKDALIQDALKKFCRAEGYALMEASKWKCADDKGDVTNKLSYRLTHPKLCGRKKDIKYLISTSLGKRLTDALKDIIPVQLVLKKKTNVKYDGQLIIDLSVYNDGQRKMRMVGQSKPLQKRPNKIVLGSDTDQLITYIPSDCLRIPEPVSIFEKTPSKMPEPSSDTASVAPSTVITGDPSEEAMESKQLVADVLENIGQHRWDYYPDWVQIGFILRNEGFTLEEFIDFSKKSKHFNEASSPAWIKQKWRCFKRGNLTQARLWKWLSEDNIDAYGELSVNRRDFWSLLRNPSHAETARFFYSLKPDAYCYNESLGWFQIQPSNVWKYYDKKPNGLLSDIWATYKRVIIEHEALIDLEVSDEVQKKLMKSRYDSLHKFQFQIGSKGFVDGVIGFLPSMYNDDELDKKMDESRNLFAFTDMVYDLDRDEVRPIKPEDWVCLNTGYAYPQTRNHEAGRELLNTIRSLFELDKDIENDENVIGEATAYMLKTIASCLHGTKKYEKFYVWTGSGGNGKGVISEIIKRCFGDYYHSIPHQTITKMSDKKDAPNPAILKAKGKRFVQASEPEADDKLQCGVIKEMSGGDDITARDLNHSTVTFKPQFGLFLQTNAIPKLNRADGGIQRRMEVLNFPFKFVKKPTDATHKAINEDLKDKIIKSPDWRNEMFFLLLEAYRQIKANGIDSPDSVKQASEEYMDENNPVKEWLQTNFHTDKDNNNRQYQIGSNEFRIMFSAETNNNISADRFKQCLMLCGVTQKKESHPYKAMRYDADSQAWIQKDCPAGKYWCGITKKTWE